MVDGEESGDVGAAALGVVLVCVVSLLECGGQLTRLRREPRSVHTPGAALGRQMQRLRHSDPCLPREMRR